MAIDTPAKVGILGAGPIGLEAALYARVLGYEVVIYERGGIGEHVRCWGHVKMFTRFRMNRSPLGLRALAAQDEGYQPPADDALLTGAEYVERYLEPLANSDLLSDGLRLGYEVLSVGRENYVKTESSDEREEFDFRLLVREPGGKEVIEHVDALIDATGVFRQPNWLGAGGMPCPGERELRNRIDYDIPDILGVERERFAARSTLVIGEGYVATTNVAALAELAEQVPETRITWLSRRGFGAEQGRGVETRWSDTDVEAISLADDDRFQVEVSGEQNGVYAFDNVIASVGYRPNQALTAELQIALDPITEATTSLVHPEPNFYILGAKSYGRNNEAFLIRDGLRQIVEVFKLIGDREGLDLYASAGP